MNFKGAAKRLDDTDLPKIGRRIGVGEDELHAVMAELLAVARDIHTEQVRRK